jgi:phosphoribosylformylglycinamidine synthase
VFKATVKISLKKTVLDPQGKTVKSALDSLGFSTVEEVRMGKLVELNIKGSDRKKAEKDLEEMCHKLLSNPIIEDYSYDIEEV